MQYSPRLQVLTLESSHTRPTFNQPTSRQVTTSSQAPKDTNQYTIETSYNVLYKLHTSNEFILACKGSTNLDIIFDLQIPTHVVARPIRVARVISTFGGIYMGELIPRQPPT